MPSSVSNNPGGRASSGRFEQTPEYTIRRESADIRVTRANPKVKHLETDDIKVSHLFYFAQGSAEFSYYIAAILLAFGQSIALAMIFTCVQMMIENDALSGQSEAAWEVEKRAVQDSRDKGGYDDGDGGFSAASSLLEMGEVGSTRLRRRLERDAAVAEARGMRSSFIELGELEHVRTDYDDDDGEEEEDEEEQIQETTTNEQSGGKDKIDKRAPEDEEDDDFDYDPAKDKAAAGGGGMSQTERARDEIQKSGDRGNAAGGMSQTERARDEIQKSSGGGTSESAAGGAAAGRAAALGGALGGAAKSGFGSEGTGGSAPDEDIAKRIDSGSQTTKDTGKDPTSGTDSGSQSSSDKQQGPWKKRLIKLLQYRFKYILVMLCLVGMNMWCSVGSMYFGEILADRQIGRLKRAYFKAILQQSCAWLDNRNELGLPAEVSHNCVRIRSAIGSKFITAVQQMGSFLGAGSYSFLLNPSLTCVTMSMVGVIYIVSRALMHYRQVQTNAADDAYADAGMVVQEYLRSPRTIFSLNRGREITGMYTSASARSTSAFTGGTTITLGFLQAAQFSIFYLIFCVALSWTGMQLFYFDQNCLPQLWTVDLSNCVMVIFLTLTAMIGLANALEYLLDYSDFKTAFAEFLNLVAVETKEREIDGEVKLTLTDREMELYSDVAVVANRGLRDELQQYAGRGNSRGRDSSDMVRAPPLLSVSIRVSPKAFSESSRSGPDSLDCRAPQMIVKEQYEMMESGGSYYQGGTSFRDACEQFLGFTMEQDMNGNLTGYVEYVIGETAPSQEGLCTGARLMSEPFGSALKDSNKCAINPRQFITETILGGAKASPDKCTVRLDFLRPTGLVVTGRNLKFRYPTRPDTVVLNDVSFQINAGEKVAFVGGSGSGKSTIVQLVQSFYHAEHGELLFNGWPLKNLLLQDLRRHMTIVSQEPILFQMPLRDNLCLGLGPRSTWPSDEHIMKVCKRATIDKVVTRLPDGLDTWPGSGGSQFSGGQKQRFAIVRALLKKPTLLLLDEATSALDYESEKQVQDTIDHLGEESDDEGEPGSSASSAPKKKPPLTMIVVAHRLSTVKNADKIFVLDKGRIVEWGSHEELNKIPGGWYAGMCSHQEAEPEKVDKELDAKRGAAHEKVMMVSRAKAMVNLIQDGALVPGGSGAVGKDQGGKRVRRSQLVGAQIQDHVKQGAQKTGPLGVPTTAPSIHQAKGKNLAPIGEDQVARDSAARASGTELGGPEERASGGSNFEGNHQAVYQDSSEDDGRGNAADDGSRDLLRDPDRREKAPNNSKGQKSQGLKMNHRAESVNTKTPMTQNVCGMFGNTDNLTGMAGIVHSNEVESHIKHTELAGTGQLFHAHHLRPSAKWQRVSEATMAFGHHPGARKASALDTAVQNAQFHHHSRVNEQMVKDKSKRAQQGTGSTVIPDDIDGHPDVDSNEVARDITKAVNSSMIMEGDRVNQISFRKLVRQQLKRYNVAEEVTGLAYPGFLCAMALGVMKPCGLVLMIWVIQAAKEFEMFCRMVELVSDGDSESENRVNQNLLHHYFHHPDDAPSEGIRKQIMTLRNGIKTCVIGYVGLGTAITTCTCCMEIWMTKVVSLAVARCRSKLFQSILAQDILWFDMAENNSEALARLLREGVAHAFASYDCVKNNILDATYSLVSIAICLYINPWLSLALMVVLVLLFSGVVAKTAPKEKDARGSQEAEHNNVSKKSPPPDSTANKQSDAQLPMPNGLGGATMRKPQKMMDLADTAQMLTLTAEEAEMMGGDEESEASDAAASDRWMTEGILQIRTVRAMNGCESFYLHLKRAVSIEEKGCIPDRWDAAMAAGWTAAAIGMVFVALYIIGISLLLMGTVNDCGEILGILFTLFGVADRANALVETKRRLPGIKLAYLDILKIMTRKPIVDYANEDPYCLAIAKNKDMYNRRKVTKFDRLNFEGAQFAYPSRPTDPILRGLTISIERGDQVALTGPSGSGKSTVMQLLMRFYDPNLCVHELYKRTQSQLAADTNLQQEPEAQRCLRYLTFDSAGRVCLQARTASEDHDNEDPPPYPLKTHIDLRYWRQVIGYVGQEPVLFNGSAKENILFGLDEEERSKITSNDIYSVARKANVDFIGPHSKFDWDTPLGPRAGKISGGQRQRLAIARALIRKPQILLLDEATSALDNHSQREVQAALDQLLEEEKGNLTTITIAHRLSTIRNCNKIFVIVDGALKELGDWDTLCKIPDGVFKSLVDKSQEE